MQFPLDITVKLLGWRAWVQVTDAAGLVVGYVPPLRKGLLHVPVYADESMGKPIYTIKAEHMFTHWFEDASGRRIGEYGITPQGGMAGGKSVFVGSEPRFRFARESAFVDGMDHLVPSLPVLNALTGAFIRPRTFAVRDQDGSHVLLIVKHRQMIDIRYRLHALADITNGERECLILGALVSCLFDISFKQT